MILGFQSCSPKTFDSTGVKLGLKSCRGLSFQFGFQLRSNYLTELGSSYITLVFLAHKNNFNKKGF